ncbi:hypothetical protein HZ996_08070 [Cryomorphaceae bacterium]|nr:hypothetical protein HZ996_08070 [Cryomorphaceae bacterium]
MSFALFAQSTESALPLGSTGTPQDTIGFVESNTHYKLKGARLYKSVEDGKFQYFEPDDAFWGERSDLKAKYELGQNQIAKGGSIAMAGPLVGLGLVGIGTQISVDYYGITNAIIILGGATVFTWSLIAGPVKMSKGKKLKREAILETGVRPVNIPTSEYHFNLSANGVGFSLQF